MSSASMEYRFLAFLSLAAVAAAQETRSSIQGRVSDPQNSPVAGAVVTVTNTDTNVSNSLSTNETGYYEANFLVAGNYQVALEAPGFKKSIRSGIVLPVATRTEINIQLELGSISESISVKAEAPLIDTSGTVSTGRVMDTRQVEELPTFNNSALMVIKLVPGMQSGIDRSYNGTNGLYTGRRDVIRVERLICPSPILPFTGTWKRCPMTDPFPIRGDGTRFDTPVGAGVKSARNLLPPRWDCSTARRPVLSSTRIDPIAMQFKTNLCIALWDKKWF